MSDPVWLSAVELGRLYRSREVAPGEVVEALLAHIEAIDPAVNAYVTVTPDLAREQARQAEAALASGDAEGRPLLGVPISIKDILPTAGIRTTNGSLLTRDWIPDSDHVVVRRVLDAGAIVLGKTNVPEYGWKGDTTNRVSGSTHNPWRHGLTAGGSSGGAAAAVATGMGPLALGSDGAGSIRIPSSFCGVFGIKPTYGTVPSQEPSMERVSQIGPISRSVADAALLLGVMAGRDVRDPDSWAPGEVDFLEGLEAGIDGLRIAWSPDLGYADVDPEILQVTSDALEVLVDLGAVAEEVPSPFPDPCSLFEVMSATAEAAEYGTRSELAKVRDRLDPGRLRHIESGWDFSGVAVASANQRRAELYLRMVELMGSYDLLVTPTLPVKPFPAGEHHPPERPGNPDDALCWPAFTYPFNLTGQPAASVPCGVTADGLPVGLHLVGRWREDPTVLRAARALERARPWHDRRPPLPTAGNRAERSRRS